VILAAAPWMLRGLSVAGTAAMFLVGGGIIAHGVPAIHQFVHDLTTRLAGEGHAPALWIGPLTAAANAAVGACVGMLLVGTATAARAGRLL
jgi:predicted DNA repair protein MutK